MSNRCDHSEFEDTGRIFSANGYPIMRCLKCDDLFDDNDKVHDACMAAAEMAGTEDDGWADRYKRALGGLGYEVVPWPAHLQLPHAATEAHPQVKRRQPASPHRVADHVKKARRPYIRGAGLCSSSGGQFFTHRRG